jgi:glutathione S-transferase
MSLIDCMVPATGPKIRLVIMRVLPQNRTMIELFQFPWSPYCLPHRRMLEYSGIRFKLVNVPPQERLTVWKLTKGQYYGVPIVRDGKKVVFERTEETQDVAGYIDRKLELDLFPVELEGVQVILWRYIESDVEGATFRLNDIHYRENLRKVKLGPAHELQYLRFKERKFGRGCIDQWRAQTNDWLKKLETCLLPFESSLSHTPYLLGERPLFVDFDLFGMIENFHYSGHYQLPKSLPHVRRWHSSMKKIRIVR